MSWFLCNIGGEGLRLTVECYSGFAGLTISCTDGVTTLTKVCPSASPYEIIFNLPNEGTWTLSTIYNGDSYTKTLDVYLSTEFRPIPDGATITPTDDIQTWLHCADIFDRTYTTLTEILSDASTLQTIIASNNAVDYMVRSTTWASDVCADSTAMTYIGLNNYCANTLLNNSTWLNAICNSTYMENVLNVKVPTMTSDTTPSGEVIKSGIYGASYPAWQAFDGSDSTVFISNNDIPSYIGYKFPRSVVAHVMEINASSYSSGGTFTFKVQGSYNNSDWYDLDQFSVSANYTPTKRIFRNIDAFDYYRAYLISNTSGGNQMMYVITAQFYGREDV